MFEVCAVARDDRGVCATAHYRQNPGCNAATLVNEGPPCTLPSVLGASDRSVDGRFLWLGLYHLCIVVDNASTLNLSPQTPQRWTERFHLTICDLRQADSMDLNTASRSKSSLRCRCGIQSQCPQRLGQSGSATSDARSECAILSEVWCVSGE